jgi:hypothetical protein
MSNTVIKDARGLLVNNGAEALRKVAVNPVPIENAIPSIDEIASPFFPISRADEIQGIAESFDFVESILTDGAASVVYGQSNTGKSFWVLDLAACVATGRDFRDELEVEQGAVVYVALEGSHGIKNRIQALRQDGRLPDDAPLFLCFSPVSLLESGHAGKLVESIKMAAAQSQLPCRLVILDTLARAMAGGDENAGKDMTRAVESIDAIKQATGAHVLVVHHCGKDEARGARGHSSLRAAVDTEIEVSRPEGEAITTVRITKQRDMEIGAPMPFSLVSVNLGQCRRGKPITSCIVKHEDEIMAHTKAQAGRPPAASDVELLSLLPKPSTASWQRAASDELGVSKSAFHRALKKMKGSTAKCDNSKGWERI